MPTVIRAGDTGPILKRLSTVDLADHLAEAQDVIEEARRRATQITSQAKLDAETRLDEAQRAGYEAGYRDGLAQGRSDGLEQAHRDAMQRFDEKHSTVVEAMQRAIVDVQSMKTDLAVAARKDLLEFAVMLACKLTFSIGRLHRESVTENLKRAVQLVGSKTDVTIRVHPDDFKSVEMFAESVLKKVESSPSVTLERDESLAPGGCQVMTERTDVDASLETQVDAMVSMLLGEGVNHG